MSKVNFTTGNFDLVVEGELNEDQKAAALDAGIRWILQRDGASKAYANLGGVKDENGKVKLPEGFKRDSIEYSEDGAEMVKTAFTDAMAKYGAFTVTVSEHVASEGTAEPGKQAIALWEQVKGNPAFRTNLGVPEDATDEVGIAKAREFLAGLRKTKTS